MTKAGLPYDEKELIKTKEQINEERAKRLDERNRREEEAKLAKAASEVAERAVVLADQEEVAWQEEEELLISALSEQDEASPSMSFDDRQLALRAVMVHERLQDTEEGLARVSDNVVILQGQMEQITLAQGSLMQSVASISAHLGVTSQPHPPPFPPTRPLSQSPSFHTPMGTTVPPTPVDSLIQNGERFWAARNASSPRMPQVLVQSLPPNPGPSAITISSSHPPPPPPPPPYAHPPPYVQYSGHAALLPPPPQLNAGQFPYKDSGEYTVQDGTYGLRFRFSFAISGKDKVNAVSASDVEHKRGDPSILLP